MQLSIINIFNVIKVAIIGASGYSGTELIKILSSREDVEIQHLIANSRAGQSLSHFNPAFSKLIDLKFEKYDPEILNGVNIVFISLPSGESMKIVPELISHDIKIVDLSADFRLKDPSIYKQYYKIEHVHPEFLIESVYGLSELYENEISNAKFVANPGCYPTSIILPLIPVLKSDVISNSGIVINSLSGVSGAGRKESIEYSFTELNENTRAYKIFDHQHVPEIEQIVDHEVKKKIYFTFIPHLVPINRGIYTTIVSDLNHTISKKELAEIYENFYSESFFVRIRDRVPDIKDVVNTNFCDIYFEVDSSKNKLIIISTLDNLLKGSAGQAVQNMNIMFGLNNHFGFFKNAKQYEHYV
jgi:N-acetyl-gamma-glutamyl-phosphate reductase